MLKVSFTGRVLPSDFTFSIQAPELKWKWEEENLELTFRTKIEFSALLVECDLERFEPKFIGELYRRATDLARAAANIAAFAYGIGVVALIERFTGPDGKEISVRREEAIPASSRTSVPLEAIHIGEFQKTFQAILKEPSLFMALDDLIRSITSPHTQLADCGRVIDRIGRAIATTSKGNADWIEMQRALNVTRGYQEWVSQQSTGSRHGDSAVVSPAVCIEVLQRTWAILNRFIEYRKRGNQPLAAPDFPQLI